MKIFYKGFRRQLISVLMTMAVVYLFSPIYISSEQRLNIHNHTARIDIFNKGAEGNKIAILSDVEHSEPEWCQKDDGSCSVLSEKISYFWKSYKIKFEVVGDGAVRVILRGPDKKDKNGERYKILVEYKDFKVNGNTVFSEASSFWHNEFYEHTFNAKNGDVVELDVKIKRHVFDWQSIDKLMFLSVLILTFFFCYRLVQYVAKFKIVENNSRIDIVFLIVFLVLLFIPASHISSAEKSFLERRTLAKFPQFSLQNEDGNNFGVQFGNWFNDRFSGRETAIKIYNKVRYKLVSSFYTTSQGCVNKKTKWLGNCGWRRSLFSQEDLAKASRSVAKLMNFAHQHNIKVYFLIAPSQGSVYGKNIFPWYVNDNEHEQVYQMADYLKEKNGIDVIYPYEKIKEKSEEEFMFFKTDTHWTDAAAFIAYNEVMDKIKDDFKDIKINKEDDFEYYYSNKVRTAEEKGFYNGRNYEILGLDDEKFFNVKYKYFMHLDRKDTRQNSEFFGKQNYTVRHFAYDKGKYNLTLFGDSFGENLWPIIPYSFKNTLRIYTYVPSRDLLERNINIKRFEDDILKNNTDVLVLCFSQIDRLMYLYKD